MSIFGLFSRHKPVIVSKQILQRSLYIQSGLKYKADLEQADYVLVPDYSWVLSNCPRSRPWHKDWNCTKIAVRAWAALQTHAVGIIKVDWPETDTPHTLIIVWYENGTVGLFDPHSREFYPIEGRKIYRLWA